MDKVLRYLEMVEDRKNCRRCTGLENPVTCDSEFDSDEVGPWTIWQGNLDAVVMVVGQDWGDTGYYLKHRGREEKNIPPTWHLLNYWKSSVSLLVSQTIRSRVGELLSSQMPCCVSRLVDCRGTSSRIGLITVARTF